GRGQGSKEMDSTKRVPNTTCHHCGEPCYVRPGQMAQQETWYCSAACYRRVLDERLTATCLQCGESFRLRDHRSRRTYCSVSCSDKARRRCSYNCRRLGCRVTSRERARLALTERDGDECASCGIPPEWNEQPLTFQCDHIDGNR